MEYLAYSNFAKNKYFNWYHNIIQNALCQHRFYDTNLHEYHHALPSSLGGTETVILTFKEHYICHWLLTKFTFGYDRHKMILAMSFFYYNKVNKSAKRPLFAQKSRAYANFKNEFSKMRKEYWAKNPEKNPFFKDDVFIFRNKSENKIYDYNRYEAAKNTEMKPNEVSRLISRGIKQKRKTSSKGWDIWVEELKCFSADIESKFKSHFSESTICEYCEKEISKGNYERWHGDQCKSK